MQLAFVPFFVLQKEVEGPTGACNELWRLRCYVIISMLPSNIHVAVDCYLDD